MVDCFYGVPEGATKIGLLCQHKWAKYNGYDRDYSLAMGRGKIKDHGSEKDRFFLGVPRGNTIILEDVTTTGDSLIKTIEVLKNQVQTQVVGAFSLTNRMELNKDRKSVQDFIVGQGIPFYWLSDSISLLPLAIKELHPKQEIIESIEKEFLEYGTKRIKLI
jgi:orotate phosphoribosyltransferase